MDSSDLADHLSLCERIHAYCHRRGWYGSDCDLLDRTLGIESTEVWRDADGMLHMRDVSAQIALEYGFAYPPATDEQLATCAARLGFALPPVLRALYLQVANGGFGPGDGLIGVRGGHPWRGGDWPDKTIDETLSTGTWRLTPALAEALEQQPSAYLICPTTPDRWLVLCDWGDSMASVWDSWTSYVFTSGVVDRLDTTSGQNREWAQGLQFQARSLEDWFERWLAGELTQFNATRPLQGF